MNKFTGIFSASLTPLNDDFSINKSLLAEHCKNLILKKITGIAIFGSTGEANLIPMKEKIDSLGFLIDNNLETKLFIPGTGLNSLKDTIFFTKKVTELNIKRVLLLPPFYYKNISDAGIIEYYVKVIEGVGDSNLKVLLYNIPQMSGVDINNHVVEKLLHKYPNNFEGIKDSSGNVDNMLNMIKSFPEFSVFSGSDSLMLNIIENGGAGAITAVSNISGELLSFIFNNWKSRKLIKNFSNYQLLQENIRSLTFKTEPISCLKALLSLKSSNPEWNRVLPPLQKIVKPELNSNIFKLNALLKKMESLFSNS